MLAGLRYLCEDHGYSNFADLKDLVEEVSADCHHEHLREIVKKTDVIHRYLKTKFSHEVCCLVIVININKLRIGQNAVSKTQFQGQNILNHNKVEPSTVNVFFFWYQ